MGKTLWQRVPRSRSSTSAVVVVEPVLLLPICPQDAVPKEENLMT